MYGRRRFDLGVLVALSSFFFVWGDGIDQGFESFHVFQWLKDSFSSPEWDSQTGKVSVVTLRSLAPRL